MDVTIIGLPQSGKTTLFNALTKGRASTVGARGLGSETHVGVAKVADPRLDALAEMYRPGKVVQAEIKYWDIPGAESSPRAQGIAGRTRNTLQGADTLLLVVRAFTNPEVPHPRGSVAPSRDLIEMLDELTLADLEVLERAAERLTDRLKKARVAERPALAPQFETIQKVKEGIESGVPARRQHLAASESAFIAGYQLLGAKPVLVAFNCDETGPELLLSQVGPGLERAVGLGEVSLCAKLEADLAQMPDEEASEYRRELGLGESALSKVVDVSYELLGLVSFLTVGDDEVRAWSVPVGTTAQQAAGAVHSDFQKGFIRAEVIHFNDLARCGSIAQGRREGVLRSEGKSYAVKDGDVIDFLVNP